MYDIDYTRQVFPYLKPEYFDNEDSVLFELQYEFIEKTKKCPTKEAVMIVLNERDDLTDDQYVQAVKKLNFFHETRNDPTDTSWLVEQTETYCQKKAFFNNLNWCVENSDDMEKYFESVEKMKQALSVSFDQSIGHEYMEESALRFELYHKVENKIALHLDYLNDITLGGLSLKTLTIILAGTGVGKSMIMCDMAAHNMMNGDDVLYITCEMSEEKIAERIDANLLGIDLNDLHQVDKDLYFNKFEDRVKNKTTGRLIIKEYPTGSAHVAHFRHLLNELKMKKGFTPKIIYIDYLNICASSRVGKGVNSYEYHKSVAEELRGLAVEFNVPVVTATQTNREGNTKSDISLNDTSESFGLPMTADLMFAAIKIPELEECGQLLLKQLKNRYRSESYKQKWIVGVERSQMRLFDIDHEEQDKLHDTKSVKDALGGIDSTSDGDPFKKVVGGKEFSFNFDD
jgi:archaellum biogenesis ATPase FlaH